MLHAILQKISIRWRWIKIRPIILLTATTGKQKSGIPTFLINQNYVDAIVKVGGIPLIASDIKSAREYAEIADALLLPGGRDVDPKIYGQNKKHDNMIFNSTMDRMELDIIHAFVENKKSILGICRGFQLLNVYFGGTLIQDIEIELGGNHRGGIKHPLKIDENSIIGSLFGDNIEINSYHHQCIDRLGKNLKAVGMSNTDKKQIIEAFEHIDLPIIGVQWHPERMLNNEQDGSKEVDMIKLFNWFIESI